MSRQPWSERERWWYRFFISPFLDAQGDGSMPAWMAFALLCAMIYRIVTNAPIGWPDAFIVAFAFIGIPIYEAAMTVARLNPERLLDLVWARMGIGDVASLGTTGPANDGAPGGDLSD